MVFTPSSFAERAEQEVIHSLRVDVRGVGADHVRLAPPDAGDRTSEELRAENQALRFQLAVLEEKYQHSQKLETIGRLAGAIAHDFNNVLAIITGYSDMLLKSELEERSREYLREIYEAGERAADLTSQLLAFSRQRGHEPRALDLNTVVAATERMLRRLIGADVSLNLLLDPDLGVIKADRSQMEQVLMNLAVNARDAMPSGGSITIETRNVFLDEAFALDHPEVEPGHYVCLAMTDTGQGIDPVIQLRIFEPFFTTKEKGKGTGLGLATVLSVVSQGHGHIEVISEPGQGATFRIYLPVTDEEGLRHSTLLS